MPSKYVQEAVNALSRLPGIGKKSALRLALHLLKGEEREAEFLGEALIKLRKETQYCNTCHNLSDQEECEICANPLRDDAILCVVEDVRDFLAIENTGQYKGLYHILGGVISPMEGVNPMDLNITSLIERIEGGGIKEIILALPTTVEGDTTSYYLYKRLQKMNVEVTTIARGVAIGDDLEYTDEVTLGRSIRFRVPYKESSKSSS
ncbi:MAG: recombination protein RecR [Bacteroidetes bacterium]|nr:MAG: recombination protein RecR [Bacteroidota bacterium]PIE87878.1 MAG: recombination protein RecR [Bacteroidota bacterium]